MAGANERRGTEILPRETVQRLCATAFPRCRLEDVQLLAGGLCNSNLRVKLGRREAPVVLRVYERDPAACQKEIDVLHLVRDTVPVPEIFHAEPRGMDGIGPFVLMEYVDGITFRQLKATGDLGALAEAAHSIGTTLAAIGRHRFEAAGRLVAGPTVGAPLLEGADPLPRFVDACLESSLLQERTGAALVETLHAFLWSRAPRLAGLSNERSLVHSDFGSRNLMVRRHGARWIVAAVLDWEFAFSGPPLTDVGHFLRYEKRSRPVRKPHFSRGFVEAGGALDAGWRDLARAIDLAALCDLLTRRDLPDDIAHEVLDLVRATVDDRDPE